MAKDATNKPAASEPAKKRERKPVDKLPAGSVRVRIDTAVFTEEEARAVYHQYVQGVEPTDLRQLAAGVRDAVTAEVGDAISKMKRYALAIYRDSRRQAAIAAAEKRAQEAAAELERLKGAPVSPLAEEPAGGSPGRKSIAGGGGGEGARA